MNPAAMSGALERPAKLWGEELISRLNRRNRVRAGNLNNINSPRPSQHEFTDDRLCWHRPASRPNVGPMKEELISRLNRRNRIRTGNLNNMNSQTTASTREVLLPARERGRLTRARGFAPNGPLRCDPYKQVLVFFSFFPFYCFILQNNQILEKN
jgi:hypothetical protein